MNNIDTSPLTNSVQQFYSDLVHQISNASFTNALLLPKQQDILDPELVGDDSYLFDTTAYVGKLATVVIEDLELIAAYVQVVRLTASCSSEALGSMVLDSQCFDDLSDSRKWIILSKSMFHQSIANMVHPCDLYELDNQQWFEVELQHQPSLDDQLSDLVTQIGFLDEDDISGLLEAKEQVIYAKCKPEMQAIIPSLE